MQTGIGDVLRGPQIYLVMFFVGALVWGARRVIPDEIEETRIWKAALVLLPMLFGASLCIVPVLRPAPESWVASAMWGTIGGTFSQVAYTLLRRVLPEKMKAFLGSKSESRAAKEK